MAGSLYFGTIIHLARREVGRAGELAEALLRHCDEQGFALLYAAGLILHGQCLAQHGQVEEGLRQMRQGMADWQVTGAVSHRPYHLALLAEALGRAGEVEPAPVALGEALSIARSTGERFWEVELHRLRGGCCLPRPRPIRLRRARRKPLFVKPSRWLDGSGPCPWSCGPRWV